MTLTRESLEAARAYFGNLVKHAGLQSQEEDAALTAIDACLSAWPAESAVEAAITALDKHTTFSIDRSRHIARLCVEAAGLHANARIAELEAENARLNTLINSPETRDWMKGVPLEAAHQIERWGADHDAGKAPLDWFWLIGYLAQKAAASAMAGNADKAKHHTISTGAALLNWHRSLTGENTLMRPGIDPGQALKGATP